jgi:hypothetical protein
VAQCVPKVQRLLQRAGITTLQRVQRRLGDFVEPREQCFGFRCS